MSSTEVLAEATQDTRRPILGTSPIKLPGTESALASRASRPYSIRGLLEWAAAKEMHSDDPTRGIKIEKAFDSLGHMTWHPEQIAQYRERHAVGTVARLALELLLNIAAGRYDAHLIGPQHVRISNKDGKNKLCWRPHKTLHSTGKMLKIRIMSSLQAVLDAVPKAEGREPALVFLTTDYGKPFASAAASAISSPTRASRPAQAGHVREWLGALLACARARKAALVTAAHAGCTLYELMALSGHASSKQLQESLEGIEQGFMADSAV